jgi:exosortase H (IPTLxxWG-CTERM-specific)
LRDAESGFAVAILPGCNGVEASAILLAGMLAFPASWKMRLIGVAVGVLAVQLVNLVRIVSLFYIGQWSLEWFEIAHHLLWQALIMFDVIVVWLLWVRAVGKNSAMRV